MGLRLLRGSSLDRGSGELGTALSLRRHSYLRLVIVAVQAGAARGNKLVARLGYELNVLRSAILGPESGAVKADASLLVHQVRSEASSERTLHEKNVIAALSRGGDLSVRSGVDTGSVDDLA